MRWAAARLERFYAFVQTKDGDLGEQLVRNGLARNYGFKAVPPGLRNSRLEVEKLQQFEDEAKQEKIGGWGVNAGRLNAHAQKPAPFSVFVAEKNARHPDVASSTRSPEFRDASLRPSATTVSPVEAKKSHAKETIELGQDRHQHRDGKGIENDSRHWASHGCSNYCRATVSKR